MSRLISLRVKIYAVLFCITFSMFLFTYSYTYRDPFSHFTKNRCACLTCMAELEDDPWFAERFNQSIHPLMTRESSVLSEETFKWWQGLQRPQPLASYTNLIERLFQLIPNKVVYMDAGSDRCRTCSVVGNSGNLNGSGYGELIDAAHFVIRINQGPTKGFEKDVGTRTTHRVLYPESAINVDSDTWLVLIPFKNQDLQWIVHKMSKMSVKKAEQNKVLIYNPTFFKYVYYSWLEGHGGYPSTGFLTLLMAIHICDEVNLFGFGANQYGNWYHYWDKKYMAGTARHAMVHDTEYNVTLLLAEKQAIQMFKGR
ncbi:CMP-N-acetylneuraminate-beta-galactosamide-alpha-2,3-sialyltransferase 1-like [Solea solea]|uniref:CMP-N-acetylneuraminate-beta-galactosamide- alpha-2,3-sialyltransferase 1-like n=1 Tax=Solea solea TaxID=90069 RepID=UPI00272AC237|nr:CMP-N-acetylneuraminate-beta-galactosamide-alpha-2,3-sialyltransferase 1-like [Solea solea]